MYLSRVYTGLTLWALVYHTQPASPEVELITNKLFKSEAKALKWLHKKRNSGNYIQPEAVQVSGLDRLVLRSVRKEAASET